MSEAPRQNDCFQDSVSVVRMQSVVAVRAVLHVVTPEPLRGRGAGDVEQACGFSFGQTRFVDPGGFCVVSVCVCIRGAHAVDRLLRTVFDFALLHGHFLTRPCNKAWA